MSGIRALYATSGVEVEVNNGGFNQYYYWNTSGQLADQAVAAFELDENLSALRVARIRAEPSLFIAD